MFVIAIPHFPHYHAIVWCKGSKCRIPPQASLRLRLFTILGRKTPIQSLRIYLSLSMVSILSFEVFSHKSPDDLRSKPNSTAPLHVGLFCCQLNWEITLSGWNCNVREPLNFTSLIRGIMKHSVIILLLGMLLWPVKTSWKWMDFVSIFQTKNTKWKNINTVLKQWCCYWRWSCSENRNLMADQLSVSSGGRGFSCVEFIVWLSCCSQIFSKVWVWVPALPQFVVSR